MLSRAGFAERAMLVLALAPHLRPQLLDVFFTRNTAIDRWRALRPRQGDCELNEELAADWVLEPHTTSAEDLIGQLLTELPEPDREIFLRRYYYLESCREIAQRLNMQEHAVTVRLSRGREKLRKQFLERRNAL